MFVNKKIILAANPFFDSYIHSDFMGKMIFIWLIGLSICSWIILLHKIYITYRARKHSSKFYEIFRLHKSNSLSLECENSVYRKLPNPFFDLYVVLKKHALTKELDITLAFWGDSCFNCL